MNDKPDGRKYDVGDKVEFTDDQGKKVPGVVHAVRYQQGRYELVGAHRPDMHSPEGPGNEVIPGTGEMVLVKGTEHERHSFEYIMVHEHEHKAWWDTEKKNQAKQKAHIKALKEHRDKYSDMEPHEYIKLDNHPINPVLDQLPDLKQHIRVHEDD